MKRLWEKIKESLRWYTSGCYGLDELSNTMYVIALALIFVSVIPNCRIFLYASFVLIFTTVFRFFSKNHERRQQEREVYLEIQNVLEKSISIHKRRFQDRKTHKYFKCPNCGMYNRVPKGCGMIVITCPKCKHRFKGKS